jgi:hypothetical protein
VGGAGGASCALPYAPIAPHATHRGPLVLLVQDAEQPQGVQGHTRRRHLEGDTQRQARLGHAVGQVEDDLAHLCVGEVWGRL